MQWLGFGVLLLGSLGKLPVAIITIASLAVTVNALNEYEQLHQYLLPPMARVLHSMTTSLPTVLPSSLLYVNLEQPHNNLYADLTS